MNEINAAQAAELVAGIQEAGVAVIGARALKQRLVEPGEPALTVHAAIFRPACQLDWRRAIQPLPPPDLAAQQRQRFLPARVGQSFLGAPAPNGQDQHRSQTVRALHVRGGN